MARQSVRTFLDAGVLWAMSRGTLNDAARALALVTDPNREFIASSYLVLEVLPKPVYFKQTVQRRALENYFDNKVSVWSEPAAAAYRIVCAYGLAALDALHLTAALDAGADEFITTEKPTKALYLARGIRIIEFAIL